MPAITSFLLPKRHHFGLSVGRTSLRAVEIDKGKVRSAVEVELPDAVFKNGVVVDKAKFITALKQLLTQGKFSTHYVGVTFSEAYAFSREYTVPAIAFEEVREAVSWHVKDLFPFPEDDIYFDWKLLQSFEKEYRITVVAVQKQVLDSILEGIVAVGLKPLGFKPGASAITRLVTLKPEEYALVTEVNRKGAYVTLVQGEKTLFTTVINYTPQDTPDTYLKNVNQAIVEMADYYKKKGFIHNEKIPVILTGELAVEEWARRSSTLIPYPIQLLKTLIPNPAFNKAYAIAVHDVEPPSDEKSINLLPSSIQQYYDTERNRLFYKALLTRANGAFLLLFLFSAAVFAAITLERQQLDAQVKSLRSKVQSQKANTQELLLLNAQAKNIVELGPLRVTPKDKLQVIQSLLSETIKINQWEYDDAKLVFTLEGEALDRLELLNFKNKLEKSGEFTKINLPLDSLETPKNVHFTISFVIK